MFDVKFKIIIKRIFILKNKNLNFKNLRQIGFYGVILITMLNATQYLCVGFFSEGLASILRKNGGDLHKVGLLYFLGFFWAVKFIWAPFVGLLVIKMGGIYKKFIIMTQILTLLALVAVSYLEVEINLAQIVLIAIFISFLNSTQDTANGALIFKVSRGNLGLANAAKMNGVLIGHALGAGVAIIFFDYFGWIAALYFLFCFACLTMILTIFFKENKTQIVKNLDINNSKFCIKAHYHTLLNFFKDKKAWLGFIFLQAIGICMSFALITPILLDTGWNLSDIAMATHIFGIAGGAFASYLILLLSRKFGEKNVLIWLLFVEIFVVFSPLLPLYGLNNYGAVVIICILMFGLYTSQQVALTTMMMQKISNLPESQYAIQGSFGMIFQFIGFYAGMFIAEFLGFTQTMFIASGLCLMAFIYSFKFRKLY